MYFGRLTQYSRKSTGSSTPEAGPVKSHMMMSRRFWIVDPFQALGVLAVILLIAAGVLLGVGGLFRADAQVSGLAGSISISGASSITEGSSSNYRIRASGMGSIYYYYHVEIQATGQLGSNSGCTGRTSWSLVPSSSSASRTVTLYGCSAGSGSVEAQLLFTSPDGEGTSTVDTASKSVTINAPTATPEPDTPTPEPPPDTPTPEPPTATPTPEPPTATPTPTPLPRPATPSGVTVTRPSTDGPSSVRVSWRAVSNVAKYRLQRSTSKSGYYTTVKNITRDSRGNLATSDTLDAPCGSITYYFRVTAYGDGENTAAKWGRSSTGVRAPSCPLAPTGVTVTRAPEHGTSIVLVRWGEVIGASTYRIQRGTSEDDDSTFAIPDPFIPQDHGGVGDSGPPSPKYFSAPCDQTYYFRVAAYGDGSTYDSYWGEYSSAVAAPDCPPPPAPTGVAVTRTAGTEPPDDPAEVEVSWNAFPSAARYRVGRKAEGSTYYTIVKTITEDDDGNLATSVRLDAPCGTDTFDFRVASYGDGEHYAEDWGESSTGVAAPTCPPTPGGVSVSRSATEGPTVVDVNWTHVTGASVHHVQRGTSRTDKSTFITAPRHTSQGEEGASGTATSFHYKAPCDQTYYFRIALKGNGTTYDSYWSEYSSAATAPDCPPPPAPTGVAVTRTAADEPPDNPSSVEVSWYSFSSAARYRVQRSTSRTSGYSTVETFTADDNGNLATSGTFDAPCGTAYYFRVAAYGDGETRGEAWGEYSTGIKAPTCPPAPSGISVTRSGSEGPTVVDVNWTHVSGTPTHHVQRGTSVTDESTFSDAPRHTPQNQGGASGTATSFHYKAPCDQTYYFRIALKGDGTPYDEYWGEYSSAVAAPDCPPPPAPTGVAVTRTAGSEPPDDPSEIEVSWYSFSSAARYRVQRSTSPNSGYSTVGTFTEDANGDLATSGAFDAPCGTTYYFRVAAYGDGENRGKAWGDYSDGIAAPNCPSTPSGVSVTRSATEGTTIVDVHWTHVSGAPVVYVQRGTSQTDDSAFTEAPRHTPQGEEGASGTARSDHYLAPCNQTYYFRLAVRSTGNQYWSEYSSAAAAPDCPPPPAPTGVTVTRTAGDEPPDDPSEVEVSWDAVANTSQYRVQRSTSLNGTYATISTITKDADNNLATSGTFDAPCGTTTYYFRVAAYGDGETRGESWGDPSDAVQAPTCPPTPTGVSVTRSTTEGASVVDVSWTDVTGASVHHVQRGTSATDESTFISAPRHTPQDQEGASGTAKSNNYQAPCGQTYYFRVALRGDGTTYDSHWGEYSTPVAAPACPEPPDQVDQPTLTTGHASIGVTWTAPSPGTSPIERYEVQHKVSTATSWTGAPQVTDTKTTVSSLTNGSAYEVQVRACSSDGCSDWSISATGTPRALQVSISANLDKPKPGQTVTLTAIISNPPIGASAPSYQWNTSGWWRPDSNSSTDRHLSDRPSTLTHRVRVTYSSGVTATSDLFTLRWAYPPAPPPTLRGTVQPTTMSLSWDAVSGAAKYQVQYRTSGGTWSTPTETTTTSLTVSSLTSDTMYEFRARSYGNNTTHAAEWGDWSHSLVSTTGVPPTPDLNRAYAKTATSVTFSIDRVDGVGSYQIRHRTDSVQTWTEGTEITIPATGDITHTITGLTANTGYHFSLRLRGDGTHYVKEVGGTKSWSQWSADVQESTPLVTLSISGERSPLYEGEQITLTVTADDLPTTGSYEIEVKAYGAEGGESSTTDSDLGFNSTCSDVEESEDVNAAGKTIHTATFTLHACAFENNGGGFVIATFLDSNDNVVAGDWVYLEVRPVTVSISADNPFPITTGTTAERKVTLTAGMDGPVGTTFNYYHWQTPALDDEVCTNVQNATSATHELNPTSATTKSIRVIVKENSADTDCYFSEPVYVTWNLGSTLREITDALAANFVTPTATPDPGPSGQADKLPQHRKVLLDKESALLTCTTGSSDGSFTALMTGYEVGSPLAALLETEDDPTTLDVVEGCKGDLDTAWTAIESSFSTTLTTIRTTGTNAAAIDAFLASKPGQSFITYITSQVQIKQSIQDFIVPAASILANEPAVQGNTGGNSGGNGANGQGEDQVGICLRRAGIGAADDPRKATLQQRLDTLNCLTFQTPHSFWIDLARPIVDSNANSTLLDTYKEKVVDPDDTDEQKEGMWLDGQDFECTWETDIRSFISTAIRIFLPPPNNVDLNHNAAQIAGCLKHDLAFGSLRLIDNSAAGDDPDSAWNPRNKHLSDSLFYADAVCLDKLGSERRDCLANTTEFWNSTSISWLSSEAAQRTWAVAQFNNKGWPITREHITDAAQEPRYKVCAEPLPRIDTTSLRAHIGDEYITVSWTLIPSCVNEEIDKVILTGPVLRATRNIESEVTTTPALSTKIKKPAYFSSRGVRLGHAFIFPARRVYGSHEFDQDDFHVVIVE